MRLLGNWRAQLEMKFVIGDGPHHGDRIHLVGPGARQFQTGRDRLHGQFPALGRAAREFRLFDGRHQRSVLEHRAGRVAADPADPDDHHRGPGARGRGPGRFTVKSGWF